MLCDQKIILCLIPTPCLGSLALTGGGKKQKHMGVAIYRGYPLEKGCTDRR